MSAPSTLGTVRLVARREFRGRVRSRSFRAGTAVIALLAAALALLPSILPGADDPDWTLAVAGPAPEGLRETVEAVTAGDPATITVRAAPEGEPGALAEREGIDAVLVDGRRLVVDAAAGDRLPALVSSAVARARLQERLADLGAGPAAVREVTGPLAVQAVGTSEEDRADREFIAFLGVVALFIAIVTYGSWVLNSVLEEKANRVVEIIVSTVSPRRLLAGKVIGNGLAGLAQLLVAVGAAVAAAAVSGSLPEIPAGGALTVAAVIGAFVLGFAFYAVGYAAAGSLVSRQEDAQSAVTPMTAIVLSAYFVALFVVTPDPAGLAARLVSLVPPVAPLAMPARIAAGEAPAWEVALAAALLLAATAGMVALAARVYTNAILRTGARVPLRQALRSKERPAS